MAKYIMALDAGIEGMEDLQVFRKNEFVDSLFGENA